ILFAERCASVPAQATILNVKVLPAEFLIFLFSYLFAGYSIARWVERSEYFQAVFCCRYD
ncbi:MAG TPA: hypothetical protein VGC95_12430, partial [Chitinophagaceae bacterium]